MRSPRSLLAVFTAGDRDFSIGDVLDFAALQGNQSPTCNQAGCSNRTSVPSDAAVESAIEQFRYRHELISADECQRWLAARGLSYGELHHSLARRLSGRAPLSATEVEIDCILSDGFAVSARALASRIALSVDRGESMPPPGRIADQQWMQWSTAFRDACGQVASAEQCRRTLAALRPSLLQMEFEVAEFDAEHVAREARWCVTDDQQSLRDVAQAQQYPLRSVRSYVDDLPDSWASALAATVPGDVSRVVSDGELHLLLAPLRIIEPNLDLPEVAMRIEQHLADQYFNALIQTHVRWIIAMTSP